MLLAALLLAAVPGVTDSEVVLGITAPLSGPAAAWGSISLAAEAWARHVNAGGGVNGRKLRVVAHEAIETIMHSPFTTNLAVDASREVTSKDV